MLFDTGDSASPTPLRSKISYPSLERLGATSRRDTAALKERANAPAAPPSPEHLLDYADASECGMPPEFFLVWVLRLGSLTLALAIASSWLDFAQCPSIAWPSPRSSSITIISAWLASPPLAISASKCFIICRNLRSNAGLERSCRRNSRSSGEMSVGGVF